jgi:hypothetical protein
MNEPMSLTPAAGARALALEAGCELLDAERWQCGCVTGRVVADGQRQFRIRPCSLTCDVYSAALQLGEERGTTVEHRLQ